MTTAMGNGVNGRCLVVLDEVYGMDWWFDLVSRGFG